MSVFFWLSLTLFCIFIQAFYTMLEMAAVSFNKVRLQYYVSKGNKRAIWLQALISKPARLFGTTLLGVNIALQVGSECSRQLYQALNLSADLAPLTQVLLVLILAELCPMFAARHYAEHVVMLGIGIIYTSSKLMQPLIFAIEKLAKSINSLFGSESDLGHFLTREEIQKIVEESSGSSNVSDESEEFGTIVSNIFNFRGKTIEQVMIPSHEVLMLPTHGTVAHLKKALENKSYKHVPLYQRSRRNITSIITLQDLLYAKDDELLQNYAQPPWFVAQHSHFLVVLEQFRQNKQSVAVILDKNGNAKGILRRENILDEIFKETAWTSPVKERIRVIDKSFPGKMLVDEFNEQFHAKLPAEKEKSLEELFSQHKELEIGQKIMLAGYELEVEESSILGKHSIRIRSQIH